MIGEVNTKMKKFLCAAFAAAVIGVGVSAYAAGAAVRTDGDMMTLLSELNIMVGDGNGDYRLDSYVSRAEMAKIAVAASSAKNTVAVGLPFSPFSDVKGSFWGAPYIQAAVAAGIVDGYIDGTFRPDGTVKYEEAINMMLKVLGYTNDDFGASYPYGQVGMATNLEMTDGMDGAIGRELTRRQVARLVCNTLDTELKGSASDLVSVHNCVFLEDVTIEASRAENSTLDDDEVATSEGKYRVRGGFDFDNVGSRGDMVVKDGKYVLVFAPETATTMKEYVIYTTLNNAILAYPAGNNSTRVQLDISDTTACYKDNVSYTYGNLRQSMEMGDRIKIRYKDNGEIDRINYTESSLEGPIRVKSNSWAQSFLTDERTKIMRDGSETTAGAIVTNDIIYYSDTLNMILAYSKKITGVYESAAPSKDAPQSVTVSGVAYEVEGVEAFNDLSSSGSLSYGDTITLLMGKDGKKAAGVASNNALASETVVGYITDSGKKTFTNSDGTSYTSYYVDIVTPDGSAYTYPTEYDRSNYVNKAVRVQLKDGKANVNSLTAVTSLSGYVNYQKRSIGSKSVAEDVKIIDTAKLAVANVAIYARVYMQRLDGIELRSNNVVYYNTNTAGQIDELILQNVTGDMFKYGMVVSAGKASDGGEITYNTYSIQSDNSLYSASRFNLINGTPVQFAADGQTAVSAIKLSAYGNVSELTHTAATIGTHTYKLMDGVKVYKRQNISTFLEMSLNEAISGNYRYSCYYDKSEDKGGRIRVIICEDK